MGSGEEALIATHWKALHKFVMTRGFGYETAEDIVQDFLLNMLRRGAFSKINQAIGKPYSYLLACLTNYMRDWIRTSTRKKRWPGSPIASLNQEKRPPELEDESGSADPAEVAEEREMLELAMQTLDGSTSHLEAFRLYMDSADYGQITALTSLTEAAARTAICRMKKRLHTIIGKNAS